MGCGPLRFRHGCARNVERGWGFDASKGFRQCIGYLTDKLETRDLHTFSAKLPLLPKISQLFVFSSSLRELFDPRFSAAFLLIVPTTP